MYENDPSNPSPVRRLGVAGPAPQAGRLGVAANAPVPAIRAGGGPVPGMMPDPRTQPRIGMPAGPATGRPGVQAGGQPEPFFGMTEYGPMNFGARVGPDLADHTTTNNGAQPAYASTPRSSSAQRSSSAPRYSFFSGPDALRGRLEDPAYYQSLSDRYQSEMFAARRINGHALLHGASPDGALGSMPSRSERDERGVGPAPQSMLDTSHLPDWAISRIQELGEQPGRYRMYGGYLADAKWPVPAFQSPAAIAPRGPSAPGPAASGAPGGGRLAPWAESQVRSAGGNPSDYSMVGDQVARGQVSPSDASQITEAYRQAHPESMPQAQPGVNFSARSGPRQAILGNIHSQMAEANQKGDTDALVELAAQRGALDSGGYQGLAQYMHSSAMARAQREQLGARTGAMQGKANPDDMFSDPDKMYQYTLLKTQNPELAQAAADRAEIARRNKIGVQGGPGAAPAIDIHNAQPLLETKYSGVASLLGEQKDGTPNYALPQVHEELSHLHPQGWDDPNSELGQAIVARARSLYGTGLPDQLDIPPDPANYALFGKLGGGKTPAWLNSLVLGADLSPWGHGYFASGMRTPSQTHAYHAAATNWFNRISGPQPAVPQSD